MPTPTAIMNAETQQNRPVLMDVSAGLGRITLNRPERHNALDESIIAELGLLLEESASRDDVRVVLLQGAGKSFCAGADLGWMRRSAEFSEDENEADAQRLADLLYRLDVFPKPTVARLHGYVLGVGIGLVAACDIAVTAASSRFGFPEVQLGLIPAVILPYVLRAMGTRAARRYMLSAERFGAEEAHRLGLVTDVVPDDLLDGCSQEVVRSFLANGPNAVKATKDLIAVLAGRPNDAAMRRETARRIARTRSGEEAREGIDAFFSRRHPAWRTNRG